MHPDLDLLKLYVTQLKNLLDEPQEGLWTWDNFVREKWNNIIKLADPTFIGEE